MSYISSIHEFVVENFLFGDDQGVTEDTRLFESGVVDSTGILELVAFIEAQYGFTVADDELVPEHFETVAAMARYVDTKNSKHADQTGIVTHE